jgi:hypothetical protein
VKDTITVTVSQVLAGVQVYPSSFSIKEGTNRQLTANPVDANGNPIPGASVSWSSTNTSVATVSSSGLVTAQNLGSATIRAASGSKVGQSTVTVVEDDPPASSDPFYETSFENGMEGGNGFTWRASGSATVTSTNPRTGSKALEFVCGPNPSGEDCWPEQRFDMGRMIDELWVEYYYYVPTNYAHRDDGTGGNNKFFVIWGDRTYERNYGEQLHIWISLYPGNTSDLMINEVWEESGESINIATVKNFITPSMRGTWKRFRLHIKASTQNSPKNGVIEMWWDGTKVVNLHNVGMYHSWNSGFQKGYFPGWSNTGFASRTVFNYDDFKIYTSDPGW